MCRDAGRNNWFVWCRWGRVGEAGATAELGPFSSEADASTAFAKKFRDKTGNKWEVGMGREFAQSLPKECRFICAVTYAVVQTRNDNACSGGAVDLSTINSDLT